MKISKPKICGVGHQARDLGRSNIAVQVQKPSAGRIPFWLEEEALLFYSGLQMIAWGSPTLLRAICCTLSLWTKY